eukprot:scaffold4892_cov119-Isochrysis_galbana.AAC.2
MGQAHHRPGWPLMLAPSAPATRPACGRCRLLALRRCRLSLLADAVEGTGDGGGAAGRSARCTASAFFLSRCLACCAPVPAACASPFCRFAQPPPPCSAAAPALHALLPRRESASIGKRAAFVGRATVPPR